VRPIHLSAARTLVAAAAILASAPCVLAGADAALTLSHAAKTIEMSLDDLAALPQTTVVTENEFSDGKVAYRGPLVRDVLAQLGLDQEAEVRFTAANDYFVDIPTRDFKDYDAILAMEADGKPLSRREKGPLWLMYPISDHRELLDPVYLRRLIWQVVRIDPL
jgi:hypothetical protein